MILILLSRILANIPINHIITRSFYMNTPPYQHSPMFSNPFMIRKSFSPQMSSSFSPMPRIFIAPLGISHAHEDNYQDTNSDAEGYKAYDDEKEIKKEKKRGFFSRMGDSMHEIFGGFSLLKLVVFLLLAFLAVAIGYQIRKNEEQSNYVRLPATQ